MHMELNAANGPAVAPLGAIVGWHYAAPAGTSITALSARLSGWLRAFQTPTADQRDRGVLLVKAGGSQLTAYTSDADGSLAGGGTMWSGSIANRTTLDIVVVCDGPSDDDGCYYQTGTIAISDPVVSLADDAAPSVSSVSGSAASDTTYKGTKTLAYAATDGGGGIAKFMVYVDGAQVVSRAADGSAARCTIRGTSGGNWVFSDARPCPPSINAIESIDSAALADGQHTIVVKVVDAGQREATVMTRSGIVVATPPPVNQALPQLTTGNEATYASPLVGIGFSYVDAGTWSGPNLELASAWLRCDPAGLNCVQVPGATALSYTPTAEDVGHTLKLAVTASNAADSVTVYTGRSGVVTAPKSDGGVILKPGDGANGANGQSGQSGTGGPITNVVVVPSLPAGLPTGSDAGRVTHTFVGRIAGEPAGASCPEDKATLKFEHVRDGRMSLRYGKASTAQVVLTCTTTGKAITDAKL